jgi:hypothetical protein
MSAQIIKRIQEIQESRRKTQASNDTSVFEKQKQAVEATKSLTVKKLSPLAMLGHCNVMKQTGKPSVGWTVEEFAACEPFLQKWNEIMQTTPNTATIPTVSEDVSVNSIMNVDAHVLQYIMNTFWPNHWKRVIVLVGTGSFLDQIRLKRPNIEHEFEYPMLILNCDPDHSEFKEDEFNLYETLNSEEIDDFCLELMERFACDDYGWESKYDEEQKKALWRVQLFREGELAVEYMIAQTAWDDVVCPTFLPDADRKILVDVTNRPQKYMPPSLATTYDAVYVKTNVPLNFGNAEVGVKKTRKKNRSKH